MPNLPEDSIKRLHAQGRRYHESGRLAEAEAFYQQILAMDPNHAAALHLLGVVKYQQNHPGEAVEMIQRAIAIQAAAPEYYVNLGLALAQLGKLPEAIAAYRQALAMRPEFVEAMMNLGNALRSAGHLEEAAAVGERSVALRPNSAEAMFGLANALRALGKIDQAIARYRQALIVKPDFAEAHNNLGVTLKDAGNLRDAIDAYRAAIDLRPQYAEAFSNLGAALADVGKFEESRQAIERAMALRPGYAEAPFNLGNVLRRMGRTQEAIAAYQTAVALRPDYSAARNNLGTALWNEHRVAEALECFAQALAIQPDDARAHVNMGGILCECGRLDESIAQYRQVLRLNPDSAIAHSSLILTMHYHPSFIAADILEEARAWDRQHAGPLKKLIQPHGNERSPERRLRIGYVSPDIRDHVLAYNLLPLLENHDRQQVQSVCYSATKWPDAMTDRVRAKAGVWRNISEVSDQEAARIIHEDAIDILVDLSLHACFNRLMIFAHKPAPVQVSYLGYCSTTGLEAMDYRISDPHLDPQGTDLSCYSERTVRLPETYWCYSPVGPAPEIATLPVSRTGVITFGSLNAFCKISAAALDLWTELLAGLPGSRLILAAPPGPHLKMVRDRFLHAGVAEDRVEFVGRRPFRDYMEIFHRIDISLDPFPYGGGITTFDSLNMGVPVVTLSGRTAVGRGGRSILTNLGLTDLIAQTPAEYLRIARELAADIARLQQLRTSLRQRLADSRLMDAAKLTRDVEQAYRQMWRQWCQG